MNYREVLLTLPAAPVTEPTGEVKYDREGDAKYPWAIVVNGKVVNRSFDEQNAQDVLLDEIDRVRKIESKKSSYNSSHTFIYIK